jgi:DNA polymerase I-like protein with 3'-5' exonuclease and polymerase domains
VLAHLAGDETLIEAFKAGEDIHDRTALKVFGPSSGLDPHELRRRAKIVNYALLYGKTAFTLSRDIGVSMKPRRRSSTRTSRGSRGCGSSSTTPSKARAPRAW